MKKMMTTAAALMVLLSCAACGNDSSKPAESTAGSTTTTELTTELTTKLTTELTTTVSTAADQTEDAGSKSGETGTRASGSVGSQAEMGKLTQALYEKIQNYKDGQVRMKMSQEANGTASPAIDIDIAVAGKKLRFIMKMADLFSITMIGNENKTYLLDEENKQYAEVDKDSEDSPMNTETTPLLNEKGLGKYLGTGKSKFKNAMHTYEEYLTSSDDTDEDQDVRYYYDDNGNLIGFSTIQGSTEQAMDFSIKFEKTVDESLFTLPAGYTEGKPETVAQNVYGKMFAMLLGGLEDLGEGLSSQLNGSASSKKN